MISNSTDTKIKIIAFLKAYPPHTGGAQKLARDIYQKLNGEHFEVHILLSKKFAANSGYFKDGRVNIYPVDFPLVYTRYFSRRFLLSFLRSIRVYFLLKKLKFRKSILHFHWFEDVLTFSLVPGVRSCKMVATCHGPIDAKRLLQRTAKSKRYRRIFNSLDWIVPVSEHMKAMNLTAHLHESVKVRTIHNGVEMQMDKNIQNNFFQDSSIQCLYAGRLVPLKKIELIIEAFHHLKKSGSLEHKLVLAGDGSEEYVQALKDHVSAYQLDENIVFTGRVDVDPYYKSCHVYISASGIEGFPLSPLEAMSYGLLPVLSDIPAHREILQNFNEELLFDISSSESLAEKLRMIGRAYFTKWHKKIIAYQRDNLSISGMVGNYEDLFLQIAKSIQ